MVLVLKYLQIIFMNPASDSVFNIINETSSGGWL